MKNIYLSGSITGHELEAIDYFRDAEVDVMLFFNVADCFNPTEIPKKETWEEYMVVCRAVLKNWASDIVFIITPGIEKSRGVAEEYELAKKLGLSMFNYENGQITPFNGFTKAGK